MKNTSIDKLSSPPYRSQRTIGGVTRLSEAPSRYPYSDDILIALSLGGNRDAFEELVGRYSRRVFAKVGRFFGRGEVIEEIALGIFAKAFSSLASYRPAMSFERWLSQIAFTNCYDELRRRRAVVSPRLTAITREEMAWLDSKLAMGPFETQLSDGERERAAEIVEKLFSRLSPETRLILVLRFDEKFTLCEIAQLMGWSKLKMKILSFRARRQLHRTLSLASN
jgi:RNA polymerase sigma-70 factor (ECF subfamily)